MRPFAQLLQVLLVVALLSTAAIPVSAKGETSGYRTGMITWRGNFTGWNLDGVTGSSVLSLDLASAKPETDPYPADWYNGISYYNGGSFLVGEATSPVMGVDFEFQEAIASWNAATPPGTWIEVQVRALFGTRETKWYSLGIWAEDGSTITRHSVNQQGDADGTVATDTLVLTKGKVPADGLQLKVRLFQAEGSSAIPQVRSLSLAYSQSAVKKLDATSSGNPALWNHVLDVPTCSQMVYPDGGNVWCSPTSVSMVLGFFGYLPGPCEPRVREAVAGTKDFIYGGNGNWPFNTAYAASRIVDGQVMEGYVARFTGLDKLEPWIAAGVPVVMSIAWGKGDLTNAPIPSSSGHLIVLAGFDDQGNPVVNDPAASEDGGVRRTYLRSELEAAWLTNSGGAVYLIFPAGTTVPGF